MGRREQGLMWIRWDSVATPTRCVPAGKITYRSFPVSIYIDGTEWAPVSSHNGWINLNPMPNQNVRVGNSSVYNRRQSIGIMSRMRAMSTSLNLLAPSVPAVGCSRFICRPIIRLATKSRLNFIRRNMRPTKRPMVRTCALRCTGIRTLR